ncbi:trypsin-like peptidase domain-containing protein [Streptomyces sp. NPDC059785]|uniref:trypsin-like peptidase domain-containing protein n=1 Tax=Streptomyces sp. NPDC059785 TaxID=3346945 RepID=UPI00364E4611
MASADAGVRMRGRWDESGRIAEVIVSRPAGRGGRASGYLVADGKVLTAWHPLKGASAIEVRFDADRPDEIRFEASVGWLDPGTDIAVLVLTPSSQHPAPASAPAPAPAPMEFGQVGEGAERVECMAFGFPLFKLREGTYRDLAAAEASCVPKANRRQGTLDLKVVGPPSADPGHDPRPPKNRDGAYEPWQGMSGAAVFSRGRVIGVVVEHHAADGPALVAARIDRLQEQVSAEELDRLENLLGCGSLRADDLADVGLPAFPAAVRTHLQTLARVNDQKYLTDNRIPFISPGGRHEADPDNLLDRLRAVSAPGSTTLLGVALVGAAGTGKTRTCFEVAARASRQGWTVLHLAPKKSLTEEGLTGVVRDLHARNNDVLLVLDYLDAYQDLNFDEVVGGVREEPTSPARLAVIASLRPGAVPQAEAKGHLKHLEKVEVSQDGEHLRAVASRIVRSVARTAVDDYGAERLIAVCGHRPVLTLLIARAIESRVRDDPQDRLDLTGLRHQRHLSYWLRDRTKEHLEDSPTSLLASAVAATVCPQKRDPVETAVEAFLGLHRDRGHTAGGTGTVGRLCGLGWLVRSEGGVLEVMHDFVADELLQQALQPRAGQLEADAAKRMFTAFLTSTRTFQLAVDTVRRWSADLDPAVRDDVRRVCEQWLASPGGLAGRLAGEDDLEETGRTLLSLLSGPPWQSGTVASWDALVRPWLERAGDEAPDLARTLFAHAVRNTSDAVPARLASAALEWLADRRHQRDETRPVLEALLRAPGLRAEHLGRTVEATAEWLRHPVLKGCVSLVMALLARDDLPEDRVGQAVDSALGVVGRRLPPEITARVLHALLRREDLGDDRTGTVIEAAVDWLNGSPDAGSAAFVFAGLFRRAGPDDSRTADILDRALNWLADHGTSPLASYVLPGALEHLALREEFTDIVIGLTRAWLTEHGRREDAYFVLRRLLERADLTQEAAAGAAEHASTWLATERHGTRNAAKWVLAPLLKRRGLPEGEAEQHCAAAVRWLDSPANLRGDDATFVLQPLLAHPKLGLHSEAAARHARTWLTAHDTSPDISYVLQHLLPLEARIGLADSGKTDAVGFVDGAGTDAVGFAFAWLATDGCGASPQARFVLDPLLKHRAVGARAAPFALAWLAERDNAVSATASFVLEPLLDCPDLDEGIRTGALRHALDWLDAHHTAANAPRILKHLPGYRVLDPELRRRAVARILECVDRGHAELGKNRLPALCRLGLVPLPDETRAALVDLALAQACGERPIRAAGKQVLRALLARTDLDPGQAGAVTARVRQWFDEQEELSAFTGALLGPLLDPRLPVSRQIERAAFVDTALAWLETYAGSRYAGHVLAALLEGPGLTGPRTEYCRTLAADWLSEPQNTGTAMGEEHAARLGHLLGRR